MFKASIAALRRGGATKGEKETMRRNLLIALALSAALAVGVTAIASAAKITIRGGNLITTFGGNSKPRALPKNKFAPVKANIFGVVKTSDGTHPSALREAVVDFDKDIKINPKGLPVCRPGQLEARPTKAAKRVCGKTTVGSGLAHAQIAFPEQRPIKVTSPITIFNGGGNARRSKLLIHTFLTVPVPAAIVTQVNIKKKGPGITSTSKVPVIAGGSGSVLDFKFNVGRNFRYKGRKTALNMAKCPDGKFRVSAKKVLFRNEANEPGAGPRTVLRGNLQVPCRPRG
jgi:hypothetical protein